MLRLSSIKRFEVWSDGVGILIAGGHGQKDRTTRTQVIESKLSDVTI